MDFTPEQQKAYDEEMQRLEAEAAKDAGVTTAPKADETTEGKDDAVDETAQRLEKLEKALKDTQTWGHRNAAEVKRLKEEAENRKRVETRPAILDANPGLEDAISHVAGKPKENNQEQVWLDSVGTAIPDLETLLSDASFEQKIKARRGEVGSDWSNPLIAIREIADLKVSHLRDRAVSVASEQARKDFEQKAKKRVGMEVPGGSGGRDTGKGADDSEVKRFQNMTKADLEKERARVLGYTG